LESELTRYRYMFTHLGLKLCRQDIIIWLRLNRFLETSSIYNLGEPSPGTGVVAATPDSLIPPLDKAQLGRHGPGCANYLTVRQK